MLTYYLSDIMKKCYTINVNTSFVLDTGTIITWQRVNRKMELVFNVVIYQLRKL